MALKLTNPKTKNYAIDTADITAFSYDDERQVLIIAYSLGHIEAGQFVGDAERTLIVEGSALMAAIGEANAIVAQQSQPNVFAALQEAMYSKIKAVEQIDGVIN